MGYGCSMDNCIHHSTSELIIEAIQFANKNANTDDTFISVHQLSIWLDVRCDFLMAIIANYCWAIDQITDLAIIQWSDTWDWTANRVDCWTRGCITEYMVPNATSLVCFASLRPMAMRVCTVVANVVDWSGKIEPIYSNRSIRKAKLD